MKELDGGCGYHKKKIPRRFRMILLVIIFLMIIAAIFVPKVIPTKETRVWNKDKTDKILVEQPIPWIVWTARGVAIGIALICFFLTSFVIVGDKEVCHLNRIYMGEDMKPGQIIAMPWQKGPQAKVLTAGFKFIPFIRVTHDLEMLPIVSVPEGHYGFVTAKDGKPMPSDQLSNQSLPI